MLLCRSIGCLLLCLVVVLSATYAQAMRHVDDRQATSQAQIVQAQLPPCHQTMKDPASDDRGTGDQGGCFSSFACCFGLAAEYPARTIIRSSLTHDLGNAHAMHSALPEPLSPPPKTI